MRIRLVLVLLALLAVALPNPRPALAGTIDISGTFDIFGSSGGIILAGDRGFRVGARTDVVSAFLGPWESCTPCAAGLPINVNVIATDLAWSGGATLDGKPYGLGSVTSPAHLNLFFSGPHLFAPPLNVAPIVALTSPVDFSGDFLHVDDPSLPPFTQPEVREQLGATATVTVTLQRFDGRCGPFEGCWNFVSAEYDLTATPEPTTLLLWGTGAAGFGLVRRARSRARRLLKP
jgi:hypothetical protein